MTRQASTIDERGEPFLMFTRRGTKEMPTEVCIQETPESPLIIYRVDEKRGFLLGCGLINNSALGLP